MRLVISDIPFFDSQTQLGVYFNEGDSAIVYDIGNGLVAKVPKPFSLVTPHYEFGLAKRVYDSKVQSPRPHGVFSVRIRGNDNTAYHDDCEVAGMVMDKIVGVRPFLESLEVQRAAQEQLDIELKKLDNLGFVTRDHRLTDNTLWVPEQNKLYLYDFGKLEWRKL